jgi:hypothetical protein
MGVSLRPLGVALLGLGEDSGRVLRAWGVPDVGTPVLLGVQPEWMDSNVGSGVDCGRHGDDRGKGVAERMRQHWPHKHGCYYRPSCWLCRMRMAWAYLSLWWRFERER